MNTLSINFIKKDLYKSKVNAKFSHYCAGKLYYTVELQNGEIYQFPINATEQVPLVLEFEEDPGRVTVNGVPYMNSDNNSVMSLSSDLGNTPFNAEIKASELNRWIAKAFDKGDFICINKAPEVNDHITDY